MRHKHNFGNSTPNVKNPRFARVNRRGPDGFILGFSGHDINELNAAAHRFGRVVKHYLGLPIA
jgi:hypothetical protein